MHIGFNMLTLWVLGRTLEPLLGRWRFTSIYLLSALGGSTMIYWLSWPGTESWLTLTVGASGAVFGLFSAMFIVQRRFGRDTSGIVALVGVNAVVSILGANISWQGTSVDSSSEGSSQRSTPGLLAGSGRPWGSSERSWS